MGIFDKFKNVFKKEETTSYDAGLSKTRNEFISKLGNLSNKYKNINEDYFNDLEEILIMADIGVNTVMKFVDKLKIRVKDETITSPDDLKEVIVDELFIIYVDNGILDSSLKLEEGKTNIVLVVGVNGVGKTTTIAKLTKYLKDKNKSVLLVAADTFRAGAVRQIETWGEILDTPVVSDTNTKDPSAVLYKGLEEGYGKYDVIIVDTAGRLQNKVNLMNELKKMNSIIYKFNEEEKFETLLVLDATTGQNGINQAKVFNEVTDITGIILTKLDGTSKGGIVLAIKEEVNIPVKFIGLGEKESDFAPFDIENYIYSLFKDFI